jgi:hypothetical protein
MLKLRMKKATKLYELIYSLLDPNQITDRGTIINIKG